MTTTQIILGSLATYLAIGFAIVYPMFNSVLDERPLGRRLFIVGIAWPLFVFLGYCVIALHLLEWSRERTEAVATIIVRRVTGKRP